MNTLRPRCWSGRAKGRPGRRGIASVLAMLYLMLFATLAVGFAEATVLCGQMAKNERSTELARGAADSGMSFVRFQLGQMNLPQGTNSSNLMANVVSQLGSNLNGTSNMGSNTVQNTGGTIYLPAQNQWFTIDPTAKTRFQATITQSGLNLVVTVHGCGSSTVMTAGAQMQYQPANWRYSLLGTSGITLSGNAYTDSYDASKGPYNAATAHKNGAIASNGNITLSNAVVVNGDARCGVGMTTSIQNTAKVTGVNAPLTRAVSFPSVTLPPTYTDLGDISLSSGTYSMAGGNYVIHNLSLSGTAHFTWSSGPTNVYIVNSYSVTQSATIDTYQNLPANRTVWFLPTCTTATWSGTNISYGTLYGPDTTFNVSGSVEQFGRIIAKSINNSSTGGMHNDESLTAMAGSGAYAPMQGSYMEVQ